MAEIVKNLSEDTIALPSVSAPSVTTGKLYNEGGALTWNGTDISAGGGGSPGGSDTQMQYNNGGAFGGMGITNFNDTTNELTFSAVGTGDFFNVFGNSVTGNNHVMNIGGTHNSLTGEILGIDYSGTGSVDTLRLNNHGTGGKNLIIQDNGSTVMSIDVFGYIDAYPGTPADGEVLAWNTSNGQAEFTAAAGGGISNIVEDTTPQLGGDLDVNSYNIIGSPPVTVTSAGGNVAIVSGVGGATSGDSGDITLTTGTITSGNTGDITLATGASSSSGDRSGHIDLHCGNGTASGADGGRIQIFAGDGHSSSAADGGSIDIASGSGGSGGVTYSGAVDISTGQVTSDGGYCGDVTIFGGPAGGTSDGAYAGNILIRGGNNISSATNVHGGDVAVSGGYGNGTTGVAGVVTMRGGLFLGTTGDGGAIGITAGYGGTVSGAGGAASLTGGAAAPTGDGGDVVITGGAGGATSGAGGDITLQAGAATSGSAGAIVIPATTAPSVTTNKLYNVAGALTWNAIDLTAGGGISKFAQDNAAATASELFNHALGTTDVIVQVFDLTVTPKELMIPSTVAITDANNVTVTLGAAPSIGDYRVVITG
ncbi:MAG: hypothetical protein DRI98_14235 [Bacteroidetes bacterium]|nr:MAG: hypothetical protein DRI98_14235 [Bacteroidota bacterium]